MTFPTPPHVQKPNYKLGSRLLSPLFPNIYRNEPIPVVIRFKDPLTQAEVVALEQMGVTFRRVGSTVLHTGVLYTAELPFEMLTKPSFLELVERIEYAGRRLRPHLDDSVPHINAPKAWSLLQENRSLTGRGIVIGLIDTGIDWRHPDFYFADSPVAEVKFGSDDGSYYADLNGDGGFQSREDLEVLDETFDGWDATYNHHTDWLYQDKNGNNRFEFGSEALFLLQDLDGDDALSEDDQVVPLETCKITKIWDQTDDDRLYVRGVNLTTPSINRETDPDHHGTHVAGILVGGQLGFNRRFIGVAPEAELLVIKTDYEEANVIAGIQWLVNEHADVILLSLGGTTGYFLDGSSLLEQTVDATGVPVVISAGNEGSFDRHVRTFISSGFGKRRTIPLKVLKPTSGTLSTVYLSVLWREPDNPLRNYLQSPSSSMIELSGQEGTKRVGKNSVSYERSESTRGTVLFDMEITRAGNVEAGTWKLTLENQRDFAQVVHCWVETEDPSPTKFSEFATDVYTITNPATADSAIAVVSYNHPTGELSYFSSQGPRIDEVLKPSFVAPGETITSPVAGTWSHADFTGVSAAAPHVAGIIALMVQVDPTATRSTIQDRLALGVLKDTYTEAFEPTPNALWGHGKVNALHSVLLPAPVIAAVQLGEVMLQNASHSTIYPDTYPITFKIRDDTLFLQNTTVSLQVTEIMGNHTSFPQKYNLTKQEETKWWASLDCHVNTTYLLNFTVRDPLLSSSFLAKLTVVENPPEQPTLSPEMPPKLTPEVPEFVFRFHSGEKPAVSPIRGYSCISFVLIVTISLPIRLLHRRRNQCGK